ncbi:transcriptional regulator, MarR family [Streptococcus pneumoniae PCS8203]|nr:Transcriptional repressor for Zn(2+)-responsive expression [Streptococcus pneumoniae R6]ACB91392.1 adc operon repressor AdcR [Streptococcus pneumoniae CGSP14]ADI68404.1 transcriptional regulator, MarR family [Streptococcus pneumoniae TCH8431/19A]ADM92367.1 putative transcriptional repressor [Streptococcus pneumoniae 670-6B]AFS44146.1 Zn(2+)-responsive expression transcriptional repressor [Streptococcus pneumoniae gamPNI0373]AGZ48661.1 MarR family transcriptional regulator [Streptococcus pne
MSKNSIFLLKKRSLKGKESDMRQLAKDINAFLNEVILQAENQHEILIGHCTSEVALTNTQEHILMLLSEESLTNSELARRLNVSQAAVTKAIKSLVKEGMLETSKDSKDARVIFYQLTDLARPIAEEHHHHHEHTLLTYEQVATQFTPNEQKVIQRFLTALVGEIK